MSYLLFAALEPRQIWGLAGLAAFVALILLSRSSLGANLLAVFKGLSTSAPAAPVADVDNSISQRVQLWETLYSRCQADGCTAATDALKTMFPHLAETVTKT